MKEVEKKSIIYDLLRLYSRLLHNVSYRNITITGKENIPYGEPLIIAPNHQNALSDSLSILVHTHLQPVFLGRASMFSNKFTTRFLNFFKVTPVYRIRDGKDTLDKNQEIFDDCVRILNNKREICIYPEAAHIGIKSMMQHKKAIPRIAFLTAERSNFEIDVKIIPVGINYSHYYNFRRDIVLNIGVPLSSKDYFEMLKEQGEAKATIALRNDLFEEIRKICVHVPDKQSYDLYGQGFQLIIPQVCQKMGLENHPKNLTKAEQFLTTKIQQNIESNPSEKEEIVKKAEQYKKLKERLNFTEKELEKGSIGFFELIKILFITILLFPLSVYGAVANGWLFYLTRYPYRFKIKDKQFYSTFSFGLCFFLVPIWVIAQFFILLSIFKLWIIALGLLVFSVPSGIIAWELGQLLIRASHRLKFKRLSKRNNKSLHELISLRNELISYYKKVIE